MNSTRFDAIARALASGISRRQLVKTALASAVVGILPTRRGSYTAAQTTVCASGEILCAERCVDHFTDTRNCGVCGELCAPGRQCVSGLCQPPVELSEGCRSEHLRLWFGAFIPWVEGGISTFEIVDGVERSLLRVPVPGSNPLRPEALLVANRQARTSFDSFSREIDARSLAHHEIEVTLPTMAVRETPKPNRAIAQVTLVSGGPNPGFRQICERAISGPRGINGLPWLAIDPEGDSALQFLIDAVWEVQRGGNEPGCLLDAIEFGPIRLKGVLRVVRDDTNKLVDVSFTEEVIRNDVTPTPGQVGRFPAFELYASLDDGNLVPIFRYAPNGTWTAHDQDALQPVPPEPFNICEASKPCPAGMARLHCGCSPCRAGGGEECSSQIAAATCAEIPTYFVLTGSPTFDPAVDVVCADPACPSDTTCNDPCKSSRVQIDGMVEVFVGTSATPVYRSDPTARGSLPPVGLRAFRDDVITVIANRTGNASSGLRNLHLHRVDGKHGPVATQRPPEAGRPVTDVGEDRLKTVFEITLGQSGRGAPICCQDGADQVCVDRTVSLRHCGGCHRQCPEGQLCLSGTCVCPHPLVFHDNTCVDPTQDATACGPDLLDCTVEGKVCARSICLPSGCADIGMHVCDGSCFRLTDVAHCGPACISCPEPVNGVAHCDDGKTCTFTCNDGFHTCDGLTCADNTAAETCGLSCTPCPAPVNGTAICTDGACGFSCNPGFISCDGVSCVDPSSPLSCGFFCEVCPEHAPNCLFGTCCPPDAVDVCASGCSNLMTDPANCGGCGNVCETGRCCEGGLCSGIVGFHVHHCTGCHQGCTFPEICENGACVVPPVDPGGVEPGEGESGSGCPCGFIWMGGECVPGICEG